MITKEKIKKLQYIKIDGCVYLGIFKEKIISDALTDGKGNLKEWLLSENMGELSSVTIGASSTYTIEELKDSEKVKINNLCDEFELIKSNSLKRLENDYFEGWNFKTVKDTEND